MMVPVSKGLARLHQREKYELSTKWTLCSLTHMHIYIYPNIHAHLVYSCLIEVVNNWCLYYLSLLCPSDLSLFLLTRPSVSLINPISCFSPSGRCCCCCCCFSKAMIGWRKNHWLPVWTCSILEFSTILSSQVCNSYFFFKCFSVFLVVVTENKGLFLFFIFFKVLHVMQLLNWNNVGIILYRDSFYWIAHVSPLTYVFRLALELWFLYQNYCLNNF